MNKCEWKWFIPISICLLIVLGIVLGQNIDPNDPITPQTLSKKRLTDHLLKPNQEWTRYYDTSNADNIQLYYNIAILLDVVRQQEIKIKNLTERIEILENQLKHSSPVLGTGSAAPDSNAASASANSEDTVKKATDK